MARSDPLYFHGGVEAGLPAREPENLDRLVRNDRTAVRQCIESQPSVAHPHRARRDVAGHMSPGKHLAALVVDADRVTVLEVATRGVVGGDPKLRLGVSRGQRGQCAAVVVEAVELRQRASLPKA